ncbi:Ribosomal RNA large subunit methyltransferase H [Gonapodya sp. JEL0774]|nr:Ribosomal RNA large subunit methyltransferase H [Gonapodya sp. JEL0774]
MEERPLELKSPSSDSKTDTPPATNPIVHFIPITDALSPLLADYRDLKSPTLRENEFHGRTNVFIAEGETVTRTLLAEGSLYPIRSVILTEHHREKMADVWRELEKRFGSQNRESATKAGAAVQALPIPVYVAPQPVLEQLTGFHFHRGVLASASIPPPPLLAQLLSTSNVAVVLERVNGIDNVGSIFRNVACLAGMDRACVLLTRDCCHPLYRKAVRVSVGHATRVRFGIVDNWVPESGDAGSLLSQFPEDIESDNDVQNETDPWEGPSAGQYAVNKLKNKKKLTKREWRARKQAESGASSNGAGASSSSSETTDGPDALTLLEQHGFTTIAFTPNPHATDIRDIPRGSIAKPAIIVGAEGPGLDPSTIRRAQLKIRIPMAPGADSLNVATSVAIALSFLS